MRKMYNVGRTMLPQRICEKLLRLFRALKEREKMLLFKESKKEHDKGKRTEHREKMQREGPERPDWHMRQMERLRVCERKRQQKMATRLMQPITDGMRGERYEAP